MRVKTVVKIPLKRVTFYPAIVLVSMYAMLEKTYLVIERFSTYKRYMLLAAFVFILPKIPDVLKSVMKKRHLGMFGILVAFALLSALSASKTRTLISGGRTYFITFNMLIFLAEMYCMIIYACDKGMIQDVIRIYTIMGWILMFVADAVFLVTRRILPIPLFLVGSKFTLIYVHIYVLAFSFLSERMSGRFRNKHFILLIIYSAYTFAIAILAQCMTGLLGYILFVGVWILVDTLGVNLLYSLTNATTVLLLLIANLILTFSFEAILQNPRVVSFIVDVLGRSPNMTGRLNIYRDYYRLTKDYLLWGMGAGNQNAVCVALFQYADTQNAILEWLIQLGIPATAVLMGTIVYAFRCMHRARSAPYLVPLVLLVFVFVFMGTVEITFSMNFFMWVAILYGYSQARKGRMVRRR